MKKPANDSNKPATPTQPDTAASSTALASPGTPKKHWSHNAASGAGKLLSTAANDQMVRNLIGTQARTQFAATVFGGSIVGGVLARLATRSVPGAVLVGGALVAKAIYDHRKAAKADELKAKIEKTGDKPDTRT
ncbi:hypothetical protein [Blastomonas sp.]|uniref:hypothetical protein n=1 Tax=Blastomonas sp. TaxID=1909299 RepID=UPI0035930E9F